MRSNRIRDILFAAFLAPQPPSPRLPHPPSSPMTGSGRSLW